MSQATLTLSMIRDVIDLDVNDDCPETVFNIIAGQMEIAQSARLRIEEEGIVVRNIGGLIIPHPAIKIQNDAEKIVVSIIGKFGR